MYQLTILGKVTALEMLKHLFSSYREIDEIDFKENSVKMMGPYDSTELLAHLINQL